MDVKNESDPAEPVSAAGAIGDPPAWIPARSQRSSTRTNRVLMASLGALAVVLITVGIAAPQIVYLDEATRYDDFVAEAADLQSGISDTEADLESTAVLLHLQQEEAKTLAARLKALASSSAGVLPEAQVAALTSAATELTEVLPQQPAKVPPMLLRNVERTLQQDPASVPVSWFAVSPMVAGSLAGVEAETPDPVKAEKTVTLEAVDRVKRQISGDRKDLEDLEDRMTRRTAALEKLEATTTRSLSTAEEIALGAPELAATTAAKLPVEELDQPTLVELNATMTAAADSASKAVDSKEFMRLSDATLVLASEVPEGTEGATRVELNDSLRSMLLLGRVEAFVQATAAVIDEQERLQAEAEAEAQARAEAEANSYVPPPTTEPPPPDDSGAGAAGTADAGAAGAGADGSGADGTADAGGSGDAGAGADAGSGGDADASANDTGASGPEIVAEGNATILGDGTASGIRISAH